MQKYIDIVKKTPAEFTDYLLTTYYAEINIDLSQEIGTPELMAKVGSMICNCANKIISLSALESTIEYVARDVKRNATKPEYEDYIDKRKALNSIKESLFLQSQTLSRVITANQEYLKELKMEG